MRPTRPTRGVLAASALVGVVVLAAGCGGGSSSAPTTTRPTSAVTHWQTLIEGDVRFDVPASWAVVHSVCRCPSDHSSATLGNGAQQANVSCSCPEFSGASPQVLALYAGSEGAVPGGTAVRTRGGLTAQVAVDATTATTTAVFPVGGDWIIVGPLKPGSARVRAAQVALEREIVDSATPA